jgi:hypothetical protein
MGLGCWAGGTVGTLYLADVIFGFGLVFLVVTSVDPRCVGVPTQLAKTQLKLF